MVVANAEAGRSQRASEAVLGAWGTVIVTKSMRGAATERRREMEVDGAGCLRWGGAVTWSQERGRGRGASPDLAETVIMEQDGGGSRWSSCSGELLLGVEVTDDLGRSSELHGHGEAASFLSWERERPGCEERKEEGKGRRQGMALICGDDGVARGWEHGRHGSLWERGAHAGRGARGRLGWLGRFGRNLGQRRSTAQGLERSAPSFGEAGSGCFMIHSGLRGEEVGLGCLGKKQRRSSCGGWLVGDRTMVGWVCKTRWWVEAGSIGWMDRAGS